MASQKIVHLIPYNYSLIHHNPGIPLTANKQPIYALANDQPVIHSNVTQSNLDSIVNEGLLLQLTDCDTLDEIRVISLRNKDLTSCLRVLALCQNLTIAYLQGNSINLHDMMYLQMFQNIKKIDLSQNSISALPSPQVFQGLVNLKFLYLHDNRISNWNDITSLTALPSIMHITLFSNPVCSIPGYRHFMVNSINSLLALDNYVITDEERIEDASFGYRFRGLNEFMKLHIPDYAKEKSAEQHLFNLEVDIYRLKRIFERNSPSILIQALYRGYRQRNYVRVFFNERKQKIIKIQKVVRGWLMRKKFKKDLRDMLVYTKQEYLMMSNKELRKRRAGMRIKRFIVQKFREKKLRELKERSSLIIQKYYRGRFTKNTSFINALELSKYPKIYFLKEQKPMFIKILKQLMPLFEQKNNLKLEELVACIKEDNLFDTIRVAEPDLFEFKQFPLIQFVKPTILSRVRFSKNRQVINEDFTLKSIFFSPIKEITDHRWKVLLKRNCTVFKDNIRRVLEQRKKANMKHQYMFQDQYKDLLAFEGPSLDIVVTLCFAIFDNNKLAQQEGDQQFLLFFETLLRKISSASRIQQSWRAYKFRKNIKKLPIMEIIDKRAAFCIQRWWSNTKLRKRMVALTNLKRHIDKIQSLEIFIEQSLYVNIEQIVSTIQQQQKFEEQNFSFDFSMLNHQISLKQAEKDKLRLRYTSQAIPKWFDLNFRITDFSSTNHHNNLLAFFHYNEGDCQILPINYVIDYEKNQLDIDRNLYFLKMKCSSIDEARRRVLTMALLTYDIHQHLFLQMHTADMLQDPFMVMNIYAIKKRFGISQNHELSQRQKLVDIKSNFYDQLKQNHQGLILSDKDLRYVKNAYSFKKLSLQNQKVIMINYRDQHEANSMEQELMQRESRSILDLSKEAQELSLYQSKKIQKEAYMILKERRDQTVKQGVWEFKELKVGQKTMAKEHLEKFLEEKKNEVNKVREISKIIHNEQKNELSKNLAVFLTLNKEEKILRRELVEKQMEVDYKEKYLKKMNVIQMHKNHNLKKEEKEKFINSFTQAKNLIEKQMKIGKRIKDQHQEKKDKFERVQKVKNDAHERPEFRQVLKSVVYGDTLYIPTEYSRAQNANNELKSSKRTIQLTNPHNNQTAVTMADESYQSQSRLNGAKSANRSQNRSYFLPPLNDSSIDNYQSQRHYTALNQDINATFQLPDNDLGLSRDIQQIYKSTMQNRSFVKNSYKRTVFAEENYPLAKGLNQNESFDYVISKHKGELILKSVLDHSKYVNKPNKLQSKNSLQKYQYKINNN
ncbi:leucine-rich repeat and iq domain-containing protein 3 [Stylonychia lemnae]|uniref:Leucine-rich repeat and iq domain-containing protein 3 n=1 Tax=Stylonychia lemnae TaxID=5949 RepID=A0A078AL55_STYLE|nr:leucine-rich repeat and iq domain-containing protein 3 [Stylonychia lemnae]|eukprot:CDW82611.1 leucine-rich repeat and iq domain-containing protein 3 [Stylonychia lemnae]